MICGQALEAVAAPARPRMTYTSRGAIVAHRAVVRAGQAGGLQGLTGAQVETIERTLATALDLALEAPAVGRGAPAGVRPRRNAAARVLSGDRHPGPSEAERATMAVLPVLSSRLGLAWRVLGEEGRERLEAELSAALGAALGPR